MKIRTHFLLVFLQIFLTHKIFAHGISGLPFIKNYSAKEINAAPDNWAAAQDERGVMYFGNSQGLLEYDGFSWRFFPCSNQSIIRSIAIAKNKNIYVGAIGEIGFYFPNKSGMLEYQSLISKVPKKFREFGDVWKTYAIGNKIIFTTNTYIFIYENNEVKVLLPEGVFHFGYVVEDDFFILDRGFGLKKLKNNRLELLTNGAFFKQDKIYCLFEKTPNTLLIGTRRGLFEYNTQTNEPTFLENNFVNNYVIDNEIYNGLKLENGNFCFGTLLGGAIILEKSGKVKVLNEISGLQDRCVKYTFEDKEKGLWLCLDNGISLVKASSQISLFNKKNGLPDRIVSVYKNKKNIYCNTYRDVYVANISDIYNDVEQNIKFQKIASPPGICLEIKAFEIDGKEHVLLTSHAGIFELANNSCTQISNIPSITITQTKGNKNIFFISSKVGVSLLKLQNNSWKTIEFESNFNDIEVFKIVETKNNKIVICTNNEGIYKADFNFETTTFSNVNKCSENEINFPNKSYPFFLNNELLLSKVVGLMKYNSVSNMFESCNYFGKVSANGQFVPNIFDKFNNLFTSYNDSDGFKKVKFYLNKNNKFIDTKIELSAFENLLINNFFVDDDNLLWIASADGLYVFNNKEPLKNTPFTSLIREVKAGDDVIFNGLFTANNHIEFLQNKSPLIEIDFTKNNLKFDFASPQYFAENELKFACYLEGLEDGFGEFSKQHTHTYSKLHEGSYTFHVKALNTYGFESKEYTYSFTILAPWYRTWLACLVYFILVVFLVYAIVQVSIRRLKNAKIILEKTVTERTKEIVLEKENVEAQKKIVEQKNKDITDSINYAQRIQQAILPVYADIQKQVTDCFILFKPRDIVSGDFYWYSKISDSEFLIACVDCTGHGVPGAFMSMIGNTLLNEIVNQKNIFEPGLILNELHLGVRLSLKQNHENTQSRDGMDIALIKYNTTKRCIEYAGANRPLIIVNNNNEIIETKADKFAIGGIQGDDVRYFLNHKIQLNIGDAFYATTDGYADQFGGPFGKKFMIKKLKELLLENATKPMSKQHEIYNSEIESWMAEHEQIDDILLMGFKVL